MSITLNSENKKINFVPLPKISTVSENPKAEIDGNEFGIMDYFNSGTILNPKKVELENSIGKHDGKGPEIEEAYIKYVYNPEKSKNKKTKKLTGKTDRIIALIAKYEEVKSILKGEESKQTSKEDDDYEEEEEEEDDSSIVF